MFLQFDRVDCDTDRHALDDADEVAGGVVWGKRGEHAAGAGDDALDAAVIDLLRSIKIHLDQGLLARPDALEPVLPHVGFDPEVIQRDDIHDLVARPHAEADLHAPLRHVSGRRGANVLAQIFEIGVVEARSRRLDIRMVGSRGADDARLDRQQLGAHLAQIGFLRRELVLGVLEDLARSGAARRRRLVSREIVLGSVANGGTRQHFLADLKPVGEERPHRTDGAPEIRFRLSQSCARALTVQPDQHLAFLHELRFFDQHRRDETRRVRVHGQNIAGDKRVVGSDPITIICEPTKQHDQCADRKATQHGLEKKIASCSYAFA